MLQRRARWPSCVDLRRDANFLPGHRLLALLRLFRLLLLGEAVLPEVEDLRDRRNGVRRDLHEVVAEVLRVREGARGRQYTERFAVGTDEAHGWDADLVIDPQLGRGYRDDSAIRRGAPLALVTSTGKRISPRQHGLKT